jgi:hypothetical protein
LEAGLNGEVTTFAMILITIKNAFMMMEIAADYQHKIIFALNAIVKVSWNMNITKYTVIHLADMSSSSSVFTCKVDSDCHGNGYCKNEFDRSLERVVGKCMCLDQYKYKPDCSEFACKYN